MSVGIMLLSLVIVMTDAIMSDGSIYSLISFLAFMLKNGQWRMLRYVLENIYYVAKIAHGGDCHDIRHGHGHDNSMTLLHDSTWSVTRILKISVWNIYMTFRLWN